MYIPIILSAKRENHVLKTLACNMAGDRTHDLLNRPPGGWIHFDQSKVPNLFIYYLCHKVGINQNLQRISASV